MKLYELNETELKSPSNNKITTYFETEQGSKYLMSSIGETKRWKSEHANTGAEDKGAKDWMTSSLFVEEKFQYEANSPQFLANTIKLSNIAVSTKNNKAAFYLRKDNKWVIATWDDAYPKSKKGAKPLAFDFISNPKIGLSCVEYISAPNHSLQNYHFGSKVTKVLSVNQVASADIALILGS